MVGCGDAGGQEQQQQHSVVEAEVVGVPAMPAAELYAREQQLVAREAALAMREQQLVAREAATVVREQQLMQQ